MVSQAVINFQIIIIVMLALVAIVLIGRAFSVMAAPPPTRNIPTKSQAKPISNYEPGKAMPYQTSTIVWILSAAIVLFIALVGAFTIPIPYQDTVTVTETMPISAMERYEERIPVVRTACNSVPALYEVQLVDQQTECMQQECAQNQQICVSKNIWGNCVQYQDNCIRNQCIKYRDQCVLKIENKERKTLLFELDLQRYSADSGQTSSVRREAIYVNGLDDLTVNWNFVRLWTEDVHCRHNLLNSPEIDECKDVIQYDVVPKQREIVEVQTLQKQEQVTKHHTLMEIWGLA